MQQSLTITETQLFDNEDNVRERIARCPLNLYLTNQLPSATDNDSGENNANSRHNTKQ